MKKQPGITARTKSILMEAFWLLYCEKPIEKITVREIVQKAGYNRGTFYEYFTDVYDVLDQIEARLIPTLNELPAVSVQGNHFGTPIDILLSLYEKNDRYYSVLLGKQGDPAFGAKLKGSIKPLLVAAIGSTSCLTETELDFVLEYALSAMIGVLTHWYEKDKPLSAEKLVELMHGLAPALWAESPVLPRRSGVKDMRLTLTGEGAPVSCY